MDDINRIKYLIEYDVSKTETENNLVETDLEYYTAKDSNSDKYKIGRLKEKEKKDADIVEDDENAEDLGQETDSEGTSKNTDSVTKTLPLGKKNKVTTD